MHGLPVSEICLSTGARWSEAERLWRSQVTDGQIQFAKTKSSKARSVPITESLEGELIEHFAAHGGSDAERLFGASSSAFRKAVERAVGTAAEARAIPALIVEPEAPAEVAEPAAAPAHGLSTHDEDDLAHLAAPDDYVLDDAPPEDYAPEADEA